MVYTFNDLTLLLQPRKFPPYLFLITCRTEEKAVLVANANRYLNTVHCIVCTEEEEKEWNERVTEKDRNTFANRVIGQIGTEKGQFNAAGLAAGSALLCLAADELLPQTDLRIVFEKMINEIIDIQIYKCTTELPKPENFPQEWVTKITRFLGDLMLTGYVQYVITNKPKGR